MLEAGEDDLLGGLLDLAGEEDLVEDGVDLVEVEDEVELADVAEEGVEDLDEEVDRLEVRQLVVVRVHARAEEQPRVPPVHDLVRPELHEVRLVLLVPRRDEPVHLFGFERGVFLPRVSVGSVSIGLCTARHGTARSGSVRFRPVPARAWDGGMGGWLYAPRL